MKNEFKEEELQLILQLGSTEPLTAHGHMKIIIKEKAKKLQSRSAGTLCTATSNKNIFLNPLLFFTSGIPKNVTAASASWAL